MVRGIPRNPYKLRRHISKNFFPPPFKFGACIFLYREKEDKLCDISQIWHNYFSEEKNVDFLEVLYPYEPYGFLYRGRDHWVYKDPEQAIERYKELRTIAGDN